MWKFLGRIFSPPIFPEDENKTRTASYVHWIAIALIVAIPIILFAIKYPTGNNTLNSFDFGVLSLSVLFFITWLISRYGYVRLAGLVLIIVLWLATNATAYFSGNIRDTSFIANFMVLAAAGLVLGAWVAILLTILDIAVAFALITTSINGVPPTVEQLATRQIAALEFTGVFVLFIILLYFLIDGLERAVKRAQAGAQELAVSNRELILAQADLQENQQQLVVANEQLKQRAERISAIANISKAITLIQDVNILLPTIVNAITRQMNYYHTGIYLLDTRREVAILRASSSDIGIRMMREGARVVLADRELIAVVASRGVALVASELAGAGSNEFKQTHSQVALPLKVREEVIGVLDIHSETKEAFNEDIIATLLILSDQVAIAIQNAYSTEQAKDALHRLEATSREQTLRIWDEYQETFERRGYRYDGGKPEVLKEAGVSSAAQNSLLVPVRLRGEVIARLRLNPPDATRQWTDDEIAIAEATADRVALALESARLLEEAQKRVQRETFLSEVSAKLGASFQLDSILRDTVEELGQTFKNTTVSFQLVGTESPLSQGNSNGTDGRL